MTAEHAGSRAADAVEPLRAMLQPDGYDLVVTGEADGEVHLRVVPGDGACEDCLVPKEIFAEIVTQHISPAGLRLASLAYPYE